jgi:hypothetical protein
VQPIKIAILGGGYGRQVALPLYAELVEFEPVAVWSRRPERARELAEEVGVELGTAGAALYGHNPRHDRALTHRRAKPHTPTLPRPICFGMNPYALSRSATLIWQWGRRKGIRAACRCRGDTSALSRAHAKKGRTAAAMIT